MFVLGETLETIFKEIVKDKKIMDIMNLPTVYDTDTETVKNKKINQLLKKVITFSVQNPIALGNNTIKDMTIDGIQYKNPGKIRMTICNLQGLNPGGIVFGRPRVEISIYYTNEDALKAAEIIKRLTKKFSGRKIDVEWEDDNGFKHISPTELECLGAVTPAPNINFYEKAGVRFGYYSSYYSSY